MVADCHIHMILDGVDWKNAIRRHEIMPDIPWIRAQLARYHTLGYTYLRDGGDRWGVGAAARALAPEYGIEYRTPLAPLCMEGHYGGFIGLSYRNLKEYAQLVRDMIAGSTSVTAYAAPPGGELPQRGKRDHPGVSPEGEGFRERKNDTEKCSVTELPTQGCWTTSQVCNALPPAHAGAGCLPALPAGADFIKIMISGLMDFNRFGALTLPSLPPEHIRELIRIAHDAGMAVMAHANGPDGVIAAAEAGVDSVEHGAYLNSEALHAMKETGTVWVPTVSTIANLLGKGRYPEAQVEKILENALENIAAFHSMGGLLAPGSDAGAWAVPHGADTEYSLLAKAGVDRKSLDRGAAVIQKKFKREDAV